MRTLHCTASLAFQGDLDIYSKTASKYDACRLLHLPNIRLRYINHNNDFDEDDEPLLLEMLIFLLLN